MPKPQPADFPEYYGRYISRVDADNLQQAIDTYAQELDKFYSSLPEAKALYSYAPGKWTLKEVLQHVIDTERVMVYRMMRFARKDKTPLPSFDENSFAENAVANERSLDSLKEEFLALRKSTDLFIRSLNDEQLSSAGIASNLHVTANAIGYIIYGHLLHHKIIIGEKYL